MKIVQQMLYWGGTIAVWYFLVASPLATAALESRIEYLASEEGQHHLAEQIAYKVYERYGEEAMYEYRERKAGYPSVVSDVLLVETYGLPFLIYGTSMGIGFCLMAYCRRLFFPPAKQPDSSGASWHARNTDN